MNIIALALASYVKMYASCTTFYFGSIGNFFFLPFFGAFLSFLGLAQWFPPLAVNRLWPAGISAVNVGGLRMVADGVNEFTVCWAEGWNEDGAVGAWTPCELENVYLL